MRRALGRMWLRLFGWSIVGGPPAVKKYVIVLAPHTSNWDFPHFLALSWAFGMKASFVAKRELFRPPLGWLLRRIRGIPVHRGLGANLVQQVVDAFASSEELLLGIAPEGTRSRTDAWKSGFYRIALRADVPVLPAFLDYRLKEGGVGPLIQLTGIEDSDMALIAQFYAGKIGKRPEAFGPVRLA